MHSTKTLLIHNHFFIVIILLTIGNLQVARASIDISYCNCDLTYEEVKSEDFIPVPTGKINNGQANGPYWIKVIQPGDATSRIVRLPYPRLRNPSIHSDAEAGQFQEQRAFCEFLLPPLEEASPYYIYVEAYRIGYIPIQIESADTFDKYRAKLTLRIGLYYGFSLAIILTSLFLYFFIREKTYLYYSALLMVLWVTFAFEDGAFNFWGVPEVIADILDSVLHWMVGLCCAFLGWDYVQFQDHLPRIKWPLIASIILSGICFIGYHLTGSVISSSLGDVFAVLSLVIIAVGSFSLYGRTNFARLFSFAFSLVVICAVDVYIPKHFGWNFLGLSQQALKIANVVGMIIFGVLIAYRINLLFRQNNKHKAEIRRMLEEISMEEENKVSETQEVKSPKEDVRSKYAILQEYELTDRQLDILDGIKQGLTNQEIADEFSISLNTVKYHTRNIYEKMGVKRRVQILAMK